MIDWLFYQQYHFANACSQGRNKFVRMEFPNGMKSSFFSGSGECIYVD